MLYKKAFDGVIVGKQNKENEFRDTVYQTKRNIS